MALKDCLFDQTEWHFVIFVEFQRENNSFHVVVGVGGFGFFALAIGFNFLFGLELRQVDKILPLQHGAIFVELEGGDILDSLHNLFHFGDSHFLDLVAIKKTFDINKMVLISRYLVIEELIVLEILIAEIVLDLFNKFLVVIHALLM